MEGEIGYGHRGKLSYLQYIGTESRPRESRVLFRYCLYFIHGGEVRDVSNSALNTLPACKENEIIL